MVAIEGQSTVLGKTGTSDYDDQTRSETESEQQRLESQVGKQSRRSLQTQSKVNEEIDSRIDDVAHSLVDVLKEHEYHAQFSDEVFEILKSPPDLEFKYMPPMDFTPSAEDFEVDDHELVPRKEQPMFQGDIFTPAWVRGYGPRKEGFCGRCSPGQWHNIEDSTYENDLTYMHGIASSSFTLLRPSMVRQQRRERWQVFCSECHSWRQLRKTVRGWNWFRHCAREHRKPPLTPSLQDVPSFHGGQADEWLVEDERLVESLVDQIRRDELESFERFLGRKPSLGTFQDRVGRTLLHYAAEQGGILFLFTIHGTLLGSKASSINLKSNNGETSLMLAAAQGHKDVVVWLIDNGADIHSTSVDGMTALDQALEAGFTHIAGLFISRMTEEDRRQHCLRVVVRQLPQAAKVISTEEKVLDPVHRRVRLGDVNELSPFHKASAQGNMGTIKILLNLGVDIEDYSPGGEPPLMLAASRSRYDVIELLLARGANVDSTSTDPWALSKGWTTLMYAVRNGDHAAVQQLIANGADVNFLAPNRRTALLEAQRRGDGSMAAVHLERGADPGLGPYTPLMQACCEGDERHVELLLEDGADVDDGTPILLAAAGGHAGVVIMLLEAGAMPEPAWAKGPNGKGQAEENAVGEAEDRTHRRGWTPLMRANQGGHREVALSSNIASKRCR